MLDGALPAISGASLTNLDARDLENALPAIDGSSLTGVGVTGITSSANATAISISSDEEVTMPLQPAFMANAGGNVYNVTGDGTTHTVAWTSPIYDIGSNHSGTTFTAPITGKYLICASVHIGNATGSGTPTAMGSNIVTSNRTYGNFYWSASIDNGTTRTIKNTAVADMDAADTVTITTRVADMSSDVVDLENGNGYDYLTVTLIA